MPVIALADFIPALLALVVLLALYVLVQLAGALIPNVPIIGSAIRNAVVGALQAAESSVGGFLKAITYPVARWTFGQILSWWRFMAHAANFIEAVPGKIANTYHAAIGFASNVYGAAISNLNGDIAYVDNLISATGADAHAYADFVYGQATTYARDLTGAAEAAAGALFATAEADARALVNGAEAAAAAGIATAENAAAGALSTAESLFTTAESDIARAIAGVESDIGAAVQSVEGYASGVADAAAAAAAAGVLAKVLPMIGAITTEVDTCLAPLCDTVTPNAGQLGKLGNLLQNLETFAADGSLFLFVLWLLTNRDTVARDLTGLIDDVGTPVFDAVRALV